MLKSPGTAVTAVDESGWESAEGTSIICWWCSLLVTARAKRRRSKGDNRSQNHRIVGVGRDLCGSSSPTPLQKQGHLEQAAQDLVQAGLEYLQRRRLHNLPGQPVPVLRHPQSEEVLPHVQTEFINPFIALIILQLGNCQPSWRWQNLSFASPPPVPPKPRSSQRTDVSLDTPSFRPDLRLQWLLVRIKSSKNKIKIREVEVHYHALD